MAKSQLLTITEFGNPILRQSAKKVPIKDIRSSKVKTLISEMKNVAKGGTYGVGLAAPQVGVSLALSVVTIRPTPSHPGREVFESVIINPVILEYGGNAVPKWEGCMSFGSNIDPVFAQAMRHEKIKVEYYDEEANKHEETLDGFIAHVFQHETDHLNGILFVDRVEESKSWMNGSEYKKMLARQKSTA